MDKVMPEFPGLECPHCQGEIRLVETGYVRTWGLNRNKPAWANVVLEDGDPLDWPDGMLVAVDYGLESYSDEGDGTYHTECSDCLSAFGVPDEEWEWA